MIHIFHTPTGWKVCQEYPEKPKYPICKDIIHESNYYPCRPGVAECYCRPYLQAVALSIANAVDVREEDQDWVKRKVFFRGNYFPLPDMEESEQELKDWKPDDNQVYALPDLDVEIKLQGRPKGSKKWMDESNLISPVSNWESRKLAHVFRKKEEKAGRPEDFPWPAKEEPKMEESQEDLIDEIIDIVKETSGHCHQQLKSKFHLTRVKAELKGDR